MWACFGKRSKALKRPNSLQRPYEVRARSTGEVSQGSYLPDLTDGTGDVDGDSAQINATTRSLPPRSSLQFGESYDNDGRPATQSSGEFLDILNYFENEVSCSVVRPIIMIHHTCLLNRYM